MGCPAKKVNKKLAGSALMREPDLVKAILESVVDAVDVPVTLKIRTGWDPEHRNGIEIAQLAQAAGIQSLAVHGRTRQCMYKGNAEYDTIKAIKQSVSLPVVANGDITCPKKAKEVLVYTGADAVMIGRGAQGKPWIFREIAHFLSTGEFLAPPSREEIAANLLDHVAQLHDFYGEYTGTRVARKHVSWYLKEQPNTEDFRKNFNALESALVQLKELEDFFHALN